MTSNQMKQLVERGHHVWNTGELTAIPGLYAPDFIGHFPTASELGDLMGHSGVRDAARALDNFADKRALRPDRMRVVITNASGQPGSGAHRLAKIVIEDVADQVEGASLSVTPDSGGPDLQEPPEGNYSLSISGFRHWTVPSAR